MVCRGGGISSLVEEHTMEEPELFKRIVEGLRDGSRTLDSLSPEESACFCARARADEVPAPKPQVEFDNPGGVMPELDSPIAFSRFLEANLADFSRGLDPRSKMMVIILGRELKSSRPAARLQAARLLGELLGIFKRRNDGGISPASGNTGDGEVDPLMEMLERQDGKEES